MNNPNCHACKYVGSIPGDAHRCCNHPALGGQEGGMMGLISMMTGMVGNASISEKLEEFEIKINEHGFNSGWAFWPANFDPVWIDNCSKFDEKETVKSE